MGTAGEGSEQERRALAAVLPAYEIGDVLGRGSFAVVYAARHRRLDREVAVKRLSPALLGDGRSRERFRDEARLLASLAHPHVVAVHDYVEADEICALVMERVHGGTLAERVRLGPLPQAQACAVILAALHGLEHAHQRGVLHRDVKPENLLFGDQDLLKVADFGIAKVVGARGAEATATAALGTPAFMAPEQVSQSVGALSSATDVWGAGAVLYELLAHEPPFPRQDELGQALHRRITEDVPPLRARAPAVDPALADVVMRALAREPTSRFPTAAAFAAALEPAIARACGEGALEATGMPIHRTASAPTRGPTLVQPAEVELLPGRARRRGRLIAGAAAAAAAAAAAVVLVLVLRPGDEDKPAPRTAVPGAPAGWPRVMSLGHVDTVDGPVGVARRVGRGGLTAALVDADAVAGKDPRRDPARFVREAARHHLLPYLVFYSIRAIGREGEDAADAASVRRTLNNPRLMRRYWDGVRRLMRSLGSTGQPAAVSIESGFWGFLEQQLHFSAAPPSSVRALVGASGLPELRGIADDLSGFAQGWKRLRDRHAPKVLLGYELNDWGQAVDISRNLPPRRTLVTAARQAAMFYTEVTSGGTGSLFEFAAFEVAFSEQGNNPNPQEVYSDAEKEGVLTFVREFARVSGSPVVLEWVPLGNTVMRTIDDNDFHWRDSWVQWLLGDARFTGLRRMRDAGVIGVKFGGSLPDATNTCPCDAARDGVTNGGRRGRRATSPDDDGGYFADRLEALQRAGGLALGAS